VDSITASSSIPFWRLDEQISLPPKLWWDYFHLNLDGVNEFSEWLGQKLAATYLADIKMRATP